MPLGSSLSKGRLRIALVVESMDSGVAQLVYMLASGLDRLGHEIHVVHPIHRIDAGVLNRLRGNPRIICAPIDMKRALQVGDFRAGMRLRRYLRRNGPFDIVHGHSSKAGALVRLFCLGLPAVRLYTPHAFYTLTPGLPALSRLLYGAAERLLAMFCAKVICSSDLERRHALSLGIAARRLAVITNAIEPPDLSPPARDQFGLPRSTSLVVGFVGRLEYQKALDVLLKALALTASQDADIRLVVIGSGSLEQSLMELSRTLGVADRVLWVGRQPVYRYLASFDVLAMPSRYEGFSLVPLDAMHAGLPIICTPVGGVEEAVIDGETGIIVPVSDADALASALLAIGRPPSRLVSMGEAARARAPLFTVERMVAATERLYLSSLDHRLSTGPAPDRPSPRPARLPISPRPSPRDAAIVAERTR